MSNTDAFLKNIIKILQEMLKTNRNHEEEMIMFIYKILSW